MTAPDLGRVERIGNTVHRPVGPWTSAVHDLLRHLEAVGYDHAPRVLGSDWPIAPYPPLGVMAGARHRRPTRDLGRPPHNPRQALTALEALRAMTVNPAFAAGEEQVAGRIAVGHRADITVLAADPLATPATKLAEVPVLLTVLDGRPTHRNDRLC